MELINGLAQFFQEYAEVYGLEMVFLYGSWAGGQPHVESDVDLALIFRNPEMPDEEAFDRIIDLESVLSARLKREVNILQMEDYSLFGIPWQAEMTEKNLEELPRA